MILDLVCLAVLLAFGVYGAVSGALRQLVNLGAVIAAWAAARHFTPAVVEGLGDGVPRAIARPLASALLFAGTFLLAGLVGRLALKVVGLSRVAGGSADRGLGSLLGAAQAGLALWVLLSALALYGRPIGSLDPEESEFASLAAEHNLLTAASGRVPAARTLEDLLKLARDPRAAMELRNDDAQVRKLLEDPRLKALLSSPEAQRALDRGDAEAILGSPEAARLLADPEFARGLERASGRIRELD